MCFSKDGEYCLSPIKDVSDPIAPQTPRSPWAKLLNKQVSKPRLSRKVATSTKINLNKYWNKFGDMMNNTKPLSNLQLNNCHQNSVIDERRFSQGSNDYLYPISNYDDENKENINNYQLIENIRFELMAGKQIEVSENLANEVREICYIKQKDNCIVCSLCYS